VAPHFFGHHDSPSNLAGSRSLAESRVPFWHSPWEAQRGDTGTRPDYLVNHADHQIEGPIGGKIAQKSRNSRRVWGGGVGAKGVVKTGINWHQSWNQIQTLKACFGCQIYCAQLGPPWATIVEAFRAVSNRESLTLHAHLAGLFKGIVWTMRRCLSMYIISAPRLITWR